MLMIISNNMKMITSLLLFSSLALLPTEAWSPSSSISSVRLTTTTVPASSTSTSPTTLLQGVTKRQSFLLDGAELSYYIQSLMQEDYQHGKTNNNNVTISIPDVAPKSLKKQNRVGYLTFVTAIVDEDIYWNYLDDNLGNKKEEGGRDNNNKKEEEKNKVWIAKGQRIIGVQVPPEYRQQQQQQQQQPLWARKTIKIDESTTLYQDSIAVLPSSSSSKVISDVDAISTASVALLGVHCALPPQTLLEMKQDSANESSTPATTTTTASSSSTERGRAVIVGGGEYAIYLSKAMIACGVQTHLVSARPSWSLPSVNDFLPREKNNKNNNNNRIQSNEGDEEEKMMNILAPSVGSLNMGFAMAIGNFDTLVDTLGDDMGVGRLRSVVHGSTTSSSSTGSSSMGYLGQLRELHGCSKYISTLTRSQQYVLNKGLLFARDPVIRYQQEVEKPTIAQSKFQYLPPPLDFGSTTLQTLLDKNVVYSCNKNENGDHAKKSAFVRGWSLSDLTELKTWPRDATTGTGRFGFPVVDVRRSSFSMVGRSESVGVEEGKGDKVEEQQAKSTLRERNSVNALVDNARSKEASEIVKGLDGGNATIDAPQSQKPQNQSMFFVSNSTDTIEIATPTTKRTKVVKRQQQKTANNPYITTIKSASDLNNLVTERKRHCILFLTASYCKKCKVLTPQYARMARLASESAKSVVFAHLDIASSAREKQLGAVLGVDKVPSVIVFQNGQQVKAKDGESSVVIEKNVMKELENVARALEDGEVKSLESVLKSRVL